VFNLIENYIRNVLVYPYKFKHNGMAPIKFVANPLKTDA